jgi:hypothetical protein
MEVRSINDRLLNLIIRVPNTKLQPLISKLRVPNTERQPLISKLRVPNTKLQPFIAVAIVIRT